MHIAFKQGDRIAVTSGPFLGCTGVVDEVALEKGTACALLSVFGRVIPVELLLLQIEKEIPGDTPAELYSPNSEQAAKEDTPRDEKDGKQWYVIHTVRGLESKLKTSLERRILEMNMQEKIFRVFVPMEDVVNEVLPGYILVEMIFDDQSWYVVRSTPGVTGFVGSPGGGEKPAPLLREEVDVILRGTPTPGNVLRTYIPTDLKRRVFDRDGGRCVHCGSKFLIQFDHIIPIAKGGASTEANLQILCQSCNTKKRDQII